MKIQCDVIKDKVNIYYCYCIPEEVKGVVLMAHGYGNHYGYFHDIMKNMLEKGYAVYAYDHRGHGRSEEERGFVDKFESMIEDMYYMVNYIKNRFQDKPLFTYGHSMGGLISFMCAIKKEINIDGQIFESPALGEAWGTNNVPDGMYKAFNRRMPKFRVYPIVRRRPSRNTERLKMKRRDPLNLKYGTVGLFYEFLYRGVTDAKNNFKNYDLPCLILHGKKDRIIPYQNSKYFYENIISQDKTLYLYRDLNHELIHEPEKEKVINRIFEWLDKRVY